MPSAARQLVTHLTKRSLGFWYQAGSANLAISNSGRVAMDLRRYLKMPGLLLAAALLLGCQPAWAAKRVALVLGNSLYQNAPQLPNPALDAAAVASTLNNAGFDVVESRHDLAAPEMRRALRDFADRASDADIAVIYYAGHGIEVEGNNYLIPVDARLERDTDAMMKHSRWTASC